MGKWEMVKLSDVVGEAITGEWGAECADGEVGTKVLRTTNFTNLGLINYNNVVERNIPASKVEKKKLERYDIILEKSGGSDNQPVGRVVFFDNDNDVVYLCNNFTQILRIRQNIAYPKYVFLCLFHLYQNGTTELLQNKTTGIRNLQVKQYMALEIPLPSLPVQQQIADVLDRASALIEKRKAQIEKLDLLVKSQFIEIFGNPVSNPKGWKKKRVKECLKGIENGVSPKCEAFPALFEQYGVLKLSAVTYGNYIEHENKQLFPNTKFDTKIEVCSEDLLMTRKNTYDLVGMCAYVFSTRSGLMLPDLIFRLIPKNEVHSIYLWQLINCDFFRPEIKKLASGTSGSMPNISKERLNSLEIPVPPVEIQRKFASFVRQIEAQKSLLQQSLTKLEQNYKSLMQKGFRGEIF